MSLPSNEALLRSTGEEEDLAVMDERPVRVASPRDALSKHKHADFTLKLYIAPS
jgi:hypothetical protein